MPRIGEIITSKELELLYGPAAEALLELGISGERRGVAEEHKFYLSSKMPEHDALTEPLIRYIHAAIFTQARYGKNLPEPFVKVSNTPLSLIITKAFKGFVSRSQAHTLSRSVMSVLSYHHLAIRKSSNSREILVAPWRDSVKIRIDDTKEAQSYLTARDQWIMSKREEEEISKPQNKVVHVTYDLSMIPLPDDPDPESIILYVKHLARTFHALKEEHDRLSASHTEIIVENTRLKEELAAVQSKGASAWAGVADQLKGIVKES